MNVLHTTNKTKKASPSVTPRGGHLKIPLIFIWRIRFVDRLAALFCGIVSYTYLPMVQNYMTRRHAVSVYQFYAVCEISEWYNIFIGLEYKTQLCSTVHHITSIVLNKLYDAMHLILHVCTQKCYVILQLCAWTWIIPDLYIYIYNK